MPEDAAQQWPRHVHAVHYMQDHIVLWMELPESGSDEAPKSLRPQAANA
jgi:hypothetical protein